MADLFVREDVAKILRTSSPLLQKISDIEAIIQTEKEKVRDIYDPKCLKCGVRRSVIKESNNSHNIPIVCKPKGRPAWMGNEYHQFKERKKYLKT